MKRTITSFVFISFLGWFAVSNAYTHSLEEIDSYCHVHPYQEFAKYGKELADDKIEWVGRVHHISESWGSEKGQFVYVHVMDSHKEDEVRFSLPLSATAGIKEDSTIRLKGHISNVVLINETPVVTLHDVEIVK